MKKSNAAYAPSAQAFRDLWDRSGLTLRQIAQDLQDEFCYEINEYKLSNYIRHKGRFPPDPQLLAGIIQIFRRLPPLKRCTPEEAIDFLLKVGLKTADILKFETYFPDDYEAFNQACIDYKLSIPIAPTNTNAENITTDGPKASVIALIEPRFQSSKKSHAWLQFAIRATINEHSQHQPSTIFSRLTQQKSTLFKLFTLLSIGLLILMLQRNLATFEADGIIQLVTTDDNLFKATTANHVILNGGTVRAGETIHVFFSIQNNDTHGIMVKELVMGVRGPGVPCDGKWEGPREVVFVPDKAIGLDPDERYDYYDSQVFTKPGTYYMEPNIKLLEWGGFDPSQRICFTVLPAQ